MSRYAGQEDVSDLRRFVGWGIFVPVGFTHFVSGIARSRDPPDHQQQDTAYGQEPDPDIDIQKKVADYGDHRRPADPQDELAMKTGVS
jgi:hypothetical protein